MPTAAPRARFGPVTLDRAHHHVCAVFDDPRAERDALDDFVLEGLDRGERIIEVAEFPGEVIDGLARRRDVQAAMQSGQLDIRPWTDAYIQDGTFRAPRMLAYVRRLCRDAAASPFEGARLIGTMDWAVEGLDGVDELVEYEAGLNRILIRPRMTTVCVYDANRHSKERLDAIIAVHEATLENGKLTTVPGPSARERILAAAALLFSENGVDRTGVDTIIQAAGVAKATFYRHFPAKDDLVIAWLQAPGTRWLDSVRSAAEARARSPRDVVLEFVDAAGRWLEHEDYVPTPFFSATLTVSDRPDLVANEIQDYLEEVRAYLAQIIAATGHPEANEVADEVQLLIAGAMAISVATRSSDSFEAARNAAAKLIS
jgi:AcrR family transcriptional regulator